MDNIHTNGKSAEYVPVKPDDLVVGQAYYIDTLGEDVGVYAGRGINNGLRFIGHLPNYGSLNGFYSFMARTIVYTKSE